MSSMAVVRASRPNFLILAPLCVWLGIALAWRQPVEVQGLDVALVMLGALMAHAAVNLLNEYQDFHSGLDLMTRRTPFSGGSGALPEEPTAAPRVLATAIAMLTGVVMIGGYFLWLHGLPISLVGLGGLVLVVGYTRWITRSPWACLLAPGLGFGPVMVLGTMLALGGSPGMSAILVALVVMLLVSELLLINQFPDVEADRRVGRRDLPVVAGLAAAARIVAALLLGAYLLLLIGIVVGWLPPDTWLAFLPFPVALWIAWQLPRVCDDREGLPRVLGLNVAMLLTTLGLLGFSLGNLTT